MRIYLDTSELINLLERDNAGVSLDEFRDFLSRNLPVAANFLPKGV